MLKIMVLTLLVFSLVSQSARKPRRIPLFHGGGGISQIAFTSIARTNASSVSNDPRLSRNIYPLNCIRLDQQRSQCMQCQPGTVLDLGVCRPPILFCQELKNGLCERCVLGMMLSKDRKQCVANMTGCLQGNHSNKCDQCIVGMMKVNQGCMNRMDICKEWLRPESCRTCVNGYFLYGDTCMSPTLYACNEFYFNGRCAICFPRYILENGQCIANRISNYDPPTPPIIANVFSVPYHCISTTIQGCTQCQTNYVNRQGNCQPNVLFCQSYTSEGICERCAPGLKLTTASFPTNIYSLVARYFQICIIDLTNCCQKYSTRSECNICQPGYVKSNGGCTEMSKACAETMPGMDLCLQCKENMITNMFACWTKTLGTCRVWGYDGVCLACVNDSRYRLVHGQCVMKNFYKGASGMGY